jgi:autotransporter-associated beta strand protein
MKKTLQFISIIVILVGFSFQAFPQQDVYSRSDATTGNWWDNSNPWFRNCDGWWIDRPDKSICNEMTTIGRNNVFIGHNNNTTMVVNGAFFQLRTLTLQATATNDRIYNSSDGGGISLSVGIYNNAIGLNTFNVPIGVDATSVEFQANSGDLAFTDNFYVNANTANFLGDQNIAISGVMQGTNGTVTKSGSGTLTLSAANTYTGLTILSAGTLVLNHSGGTTIPITNNVTVNGGTLQISSNQTIHDLYLADGSSLTIDAGSTLTVNGTLTIGGSVTITGGGTIAYGASGTLVYAQTANDLSYNVGLEWPTPASPPANVTINLTGSGLPHINLLDSKTVNGGTLTLIAGLINTGLTFNVLASGAIIGGSATSYIDGKLQRFFTSPGSHTFPIGRGTNYAPVSVNFTALSGLSTVTAEIYNSALLGSMPANVTPFTDHYWRITQSGGANMQFTVTLDGIGFTATNPVMLRGNDATNSAYAVTTPNYTNSVSFTTFNTNPNFGLGNSSTTVSLEAGTLADFGNVCVNTTAGPNSFTLSGTALTSDDVVVGALAGYTYSSSSGGTYTPTLTLPSAGGTFSATVYVKFTPTAAGSYNGNIPVSGGGASAINVPVTGSGTSTVASVTTSSPATAITSTTATCSGDVTAGGCGTISARGICYGESLDPDIAGTHSTETGNTGAFSSDLSGLTPGTLYHFRAYVTTEAGTSYGEDATFTTLGSAASTWDGSTSNAWDDPTNWSDGVPGATTDVTIPAGLTNYPTITSAAHCKNFTLAAGTSVLGNGFLTVNGISTADLYLTGGANWHLFMMPTSSSIGAAAPFFNGAYLDDYIESAGAWTRLTDANPVSAFHGYSINFASNTTLTFTGNLNSGDHTFSSLSYTSGAGGYGAGWHLLGNPFPSAVNTTSGNWAKANMDNAIYVWSDGVGNYLISPGTLNGDIIPAMQGFVVHATSAAASITVPEAARVHDNTSFYKSGKSIENGLLLTVNGNNYSDKAVVAFNAMATTGFDSQFDAYKLAGLDAAPQLYSILPDEKATVNTLPSIESNPIVPLGLKVGASTTYTLTISGMESFDPNTPIRLDDLKLGTSLDVRLNPTYSFTAAPGDVENRFQLRFKSATGIDETPVTSVRIFAADHQIHITHSAVEKGNVYVYSVSGQLIATATLSAGETLIGIDAPGVYLVKVISDKAVVPGKVVIN